MPCEPVELEITRIGGAGDGVAQWRGEMVYLPFTAPGDRVRAVLGRRRGGGREGRVVAQLAAGPGRGRPRCRHFGRCGGCALQHLDSAAYQATKLASLGAVLARAGIAPDKIHPLRTVPPGRRRARLGIARPKSAHEPPRIGFRERFRHDLVDLRECAVLEPALWALVPALRRLIPELLLAGGAAEVTLTRSDSGLDLLIAADHRPAVVALEALAAVAGEYDLARVVWRVAREDIPVVERRPVRVLRSGIAVPLPPGGFLQASEAAEVVLVEEVLAGIGLRRPAIDLFSGLGGFACALAGGGGVHAVDGDAQCAAALAAAMRHTAGFTVERRDLARNPVPPETLSRFAAAVFDPPRAGAAPQAEALARASLAVIVAVSCNPATFARDAARLLAGGFHLDRVVPVDQFVWTPHLELVGVFRR